MNEETRKENRSDEKQLALQAVKNIKCYKYNKIGHVLHVKNDLKVYSISKRNKTTIKKKNVSLTQISATYKERYMLSVALARYYGAYTRIS